MSALTSFVTQTKTDLLQLGTAVVTGGLVTTDATGISATIKYVQDGAGTSTALGISTGGVTVNGVFKIGTSTLALSGAYTITATLTGATTVTFPTTGTLATINGALGTPTSGTLTNATGLPISTGVSGLGTGVATFLATPTSANLIAAVTDETGSGALVFGTAPTISQPNLVGVVNASSAATGSVGQIISSIVLVGSAVSLTTATTANVTSIVLTAGQWEVYGVVQLTCGPTTQGSLQTCGIVTTSATIDMAPALNNGIARFIYTSAWVAGTNGTPIINLAPVEFNVSGNTTVYLINNLSFTTSTAAAYGKLVARRVR